LGTKPSVKSQHRGENNIKNNYEYNLHAICSGSSLQLSGWTG